MESFHIVSHFCVKKCCNLSRIYVSRYRNIDVLVYSAGTFVYFLLIPIWTSKNTHNMDWAPELKHSRHHIKKVLLYELQVDTEGGHVLHAHVKPEAFRSHWQETLLLARRRVFPWKPKQVRALTGRRVEARGVETQERGQRTKKPATLNSRNLPEALLPKTTLTSISFEGLPVRNPKSRLSRWQFLMIFLC